MIDKQIIIQLEFENRDESGPNSHTEMLIKELFINDTFDLFVSYLLRNVSKFEIKMKFSSCMPTVNPMYDTRDTVCNALKQFLEDCNYTIHSTGKDCSANSFLCGEIKSKNWYFLDSIHGERTDFCAKCDGLDN